MAWVALCLILLLLTFSAIIRASLTNLEHELAQAVTLDFTQYAADDEFNVSIMTAAGDIVCLGKVSAAIQSEFACHFDMLQPGKNMLLITIYSIQRQEVILRQTKPFHYAADDGDGDGDGLARYKRTPTGKQAVVLSALTTLLGLVGWCCVSCSAEMQTQ